MKSLKNHISLILALFAILFAVQIFFISERTVSSYEKSLHNSYSIIVLAKTPIDENSFLSRYKILEDLEQISADKMLSQFKNELSATNIGLLKSSLPKFYRLHLTHYPTPKEISALSYRLEAQKNIVKVESFSKTHDRIHRMLLLLSQIHIFFALSIVVIAVLLIIKEMSIWHYEHQNRMSIMSLFGAPMWLRSAVLYKIAIIDAFLSTIFTSILFIALGENKQLNGYLNAILETDIDLLLPLDALKLLSIAIVTSILLASLVIFRQKERV